MKKLPSDLIIESYAEGSSPVHSADHRSENEDGFTVISSDSGGMSYKTLVTGPADALGYEARSRLSSLVGRVVGYYLARAGLSDISRVLTAGLGNPSVTSDSLGHDTTLRVVSDGVRSFSFVPLTKARTGIPTASLVRSAADECHAEAIIAVDALAAREAHRLGSVIQITDHGIRPGSGISASAEEISRPTMGRAVIVIGVPTVMRTDLTTPDGRELYVTPSNIDSLTSAFSAVIAGGVNTALFGNKSGGGIG